MATKKAKLKNKIILIYNPNAGSKRKQVGAGREITLENVKSLLDQYQLPADYVPTQGPKHATTLARNSVKEGYETVLVAGGDGTVNEVANGLVGSNVTMGIIPMGTFMNIARMLSIPMDIEKAIQLIKIHRVRKIDVGVVTRLEGEKLSEPYYFLESSGVGVDARIQQHVKRLERGKISSIFHIIKSFAMLSLEKMEITTDDRTINCKASMVTVANGPYNGAALLMAPNAKLNDHRLTVVIYKMRRRKLGKHFSRMLALNKVDRRKITTIKTKTVKITAGKNVLVHVDASLFGPTPVSYKIRPNALSVICGFPTPEEHASLKSRTYLDP